MILTGAPPRLDMGRLWEPPGACLRRAAEPYCVRTGLRQSERACRAGAYQDDVRVGLERRLFGHDGKVGPV